MIRRESEWRKNHGELSNSVNRSSLLGPITDAASADDPMRTLENLVYAVSASENWLIRVKYLVSEKPAGRLERLEGG